MKRGMQGEASTAAPGPGSSHDEAKCTARSTTIRPSTGGLSQPAFAGLHRPRQRALLAELSRWHQWSRARYRRPRAGASASAYARWQQHFGQRPRSWLTCGRGNRRAACPEPRAKQWSAATAAKETARPIHADADAREPKYCPFSRQQHPIMRCRCQYLGTYL